MAGWAYCCCGGPFTLKAFDNSSTFTELGRVDTTTKPRGLAINASNVFVYQFTEAAGSNFRRVKRYDTTLTLEQNFDAGYLGAQYNSEGSFGVNSSGVVAFDQTRSVAVNRNAAASFGTGGSLSWEKSLDAPTFSNSINTLCIDGSGNVFTGGIQDSKVTGYLFDSSGTKTWSAVIDTGFGTGNWFSFFDSAGYVWLAYMLSGDGKLKRIDTSGAVVQTVTLTGRTITKIRSDGSTGIWTQHGTGVAAGTKFERFDSSGASVVDWTDSDVRGFNFAVDGSNNLYSLVRISAVWYVRKYNSSGTTQWTGTDIGWPDAGGTTTDYPYGIQADSGVVYVAGPRVVP